MFGLKWYIARYKVHYSSPLYKGNEKGFEMLMARSDEIALKKFESIFDKYGGEVTYTVRQIGSKEDI